MTRDQVRIIACLAGAAAGALIYVLVVGEIALGKYRAWRRDVWTNGETHRRGKER